MPAKVSSVPAPLCLPLCSLWVLLVLLGSTRISQMLPCSGDRSAAVLFDSTGFRWRVI